VRVLRQSSCGDDESGVNALREALKDHVNGPPQDDIFILSIKRKN